jgi:hypothetical protein
MATKHLLWQIYHVSRTTEHLQVMLIRIRPRRFKYRGGQRPQRHADRWPGNKTFSSARLIIPAVNDLANDPASQ